MLVSVFGEGETLSFANRSPSTSAEPLPAAPSATTAARPTPSPGTSSPAPRPCLQGATLARAWLTGFLTRADRNDDRWASQVAGLSAPSLVDQLRAAGPDGVGLASLRSWRVQRVDPVAAVDRSVDTPTRRVLAYAATVTDGKATEQKPFVLYSYLDPDGCWRVEDVEQPYSSEG